jgi:hypothetical protein
VNAGVDALFPYLLGRRDRAGWERDLLASSARSSDGFLIGPYRPVRRFAATKNPSRQVAIEGSAQAADLSAVCALSKYEN